MWQYVVVTGSTWRLLEILPRKISTFYCRVSYVTETRIPSLVLRNTWHYVIIRHQKFWFSKFVLRCSYEAALRKGWPWHNQCKVAWCPAPPRHLMRPYARKVDSFHQKCIHIYYWSVSTQSKTLYFIVMCFSYIWNKKVILGSKHNLEHNMIILGEKKIF